MQHRGHSPFPRATDTHAIVIGACFVTVTPFVKLFPSSVLQQSSSAHSKLPQSVQPVPLEVTADMKLPFASAKSIPDDLRSPQQLFDVAAADKDYSQKACLRSIAARTVILTGDPIQHSERISSQMPSETPPSPPIKEPHGLLSRVIQPFRRRRYLKMAPAPKSVPGTTGAIGAGACGYAITSISHAEPGVWRGQKAHFIRLQVEYHPSAARHLERVEVTVRAWKAGDALQSLASLSHLHLLSLDPPDAPEYGDEAPAISLYTPRAVVGREAGSKSEPYWDGHFRPGDHFVYYAQASAPHDEDNDGEDNTQPCSLLHIVAFGDRQEMCPIPSFDVGMVILSGGKPFDLTVYSTGVHLGVRGVRRYLFDPYKPAKIGPSTQLIPKGERPIAIDFSKQEMKAEVHKRVAWCRPYDTIWLGGPQGCAEDPAASGRKCFSRLCRMCRQAARQTTD